MSEQGGNDRVIIVAPSRLWVEDWCHRQDPPLNPRSKSLIVLTSRHDAYRLMGVRLEDWRVVVLRWPEMTPDYNAVRDALLYRGWSDPGRSDS